MREMVIQLVLAVMPNVVVGVFMAAYNRRQKARDDRDEERETQRVKGEMLRLDLLVATAQMGYATTMAMKRGSTNGEVEQAIAQYEKAMAKFRNFEREQLAKAAVE